MTATLPSARLETDSLLESSAPLRLAPSHHLVRSEGEWLLYLPDGLTLRLKVEDDVMGGVRDVLIDARGAKSAPPEVRGVLRRFLDRGFAELATGAAADSPNADLAVSLVAEGPIAEALGEVLRSAGLGEPNPVAPGELPASADDLDLVVACAGWLPDAAWQRLDAWCRSSGAAWHGCYAEGDSFYIGPYYSPSDPATPSYRDARDRRLAADAHPDGLEAYWRYLDLGEGVTPVVWPDAGSVAVIAGTLASDILAVARGERPPSHGHQLAYHPPTGAWRRHPVLPVPRGLMTESLP